MEQLGTSGEALDRRLEEEDRERDEFLRKYPTRWSRIKRVLFFWRGRDK